MAHKHPPCAGARSTTGGGDRMAASGVFVTALAGGAAGRVAPLRGELTLSFLYRLAARYHLGLRDLLAAITETDGRQNVAGVLHSDSEIHLNTEARERVCVLSRVPAAVLEGALPAWTRAESRAHYPGGPAGRLTRGEEAVAPWGPACPACCAARTGRRVPARRYLAPEERVCVGAAFTAAAPSATPVPRITRAAAVPSNSTACVLRVLSSFRASGLFPPGVLDRERCVSEGCSTSISSLIESPQLNSMTQR